MPIKHLARGDSDETAKTVMSSITIFGNATDIKSVNSLTFTRLPKDILELFLLMSIVCKIDKCRKKVLILKNRGSLCKGFNENWVGSKD